MGQNPSRELDTLEIQAGKPEPHPDLGFLLELNADLVDDATRRDSTGEPKWRLARPNSKTLVLNSKYKLSADESMVHKLWLMYSVLKTEGRIREFFTFMPPEERTRVAGDLAPLLWSQCRDVFERWQRELDQLWCALPGLESDVELAPKLRQWLRERNQSDVGLPSELYARFCAFKNGSLKPTPKILAFLTALGMDWNRDRALAVKLYTAAHLPGSSLPGKQDPRQDPLQLLRARLLAASNKLYQNRDFRRFLLCPEDQEAQKIGERWMISGAKRDLLRSRHLPRTVLWDLLFNAGIRCLSERTPSRVLDRVYRELLSSSLEPTMLRWCAELASAVDPSSRVGQAQALALRVMLLREDVAEKVRYARQGFLDAAFEEPESCAEYVDKLLEHGCLFLLNDTSRFSPEHLSGIMRAIGCQSANELDARMREALCENYLYSWLDDRHVQCRGLAKNWMLDQYRIMSLACLTGSPECKDPFFAAHGLIAGAQQHVEQEDPEDQRAQRDQRARQRAGQTAESEQDLLKRALRMFTVDFDPEEREDQDRLHRMATCLGVSRQCQDRLCDESELASQVLTALHQKLVGNEHLVDLLLQESADPASFQSLVRKLRELSKYNQQKITVVREPATLAQMFRQQTGILLDLAKSGTDARLGLSGSDAEKMEKLAELLDLYVSRDLLVKIARLHSSKPVADSSSARTLLFS